MYHICFAYSLLSDQADQVTIAIHQKMQSHKCYSCIVLCYTDVLKLPCRTGSIVDLIEDPEAAAWKQKSFNFYDKRVMGGAWEQEARPDVIREFFRVLAVCHTVIPDGQLPVLLTFELVCYVCNEPYTDRQTY